MCERPPTLPPRNTVLGSGSTINKVSEPRMGRQSGVARPQKGKVVLSAPCVVMGGFAGTREIAPLPLDGPPAGAFSYGYFWFDCASLLCG